MRAHGYAKALCQEPSFGDSTLNGTLSDRELFERDFYAWFDRLTPEELAEADKSANVEPVWAAREQE